MASRKKAEDKNLAILRGLVSQPHNKKCFDCRQRGPTYVNMTIGGFVCTSCSGLLRGLNPPHRIKSISMASFNPQEIEFLQNHGNEVCRQTWLGLWNSVLPPEPESRDEQKVKDFLIKKYERRTWYTSQPRPKSPAPAPEAKPLKQLLGENAPKMVVDSRNQAHANENNSVASSQSTAISRRSSAHQSQQPAFSLLGDLGADPFGSSTSSPQQQQPAFDAFASSPTATASFSGFGQQQAQNQNAPFDAFASSPPRQSSGSFTAFTAAPAAGQQNQDFFSGTSSSVPAAAAPVNGIGSTSSSMLPVGDRYSALSDLDDLFRSSNTSSVFSAQPNGNAPQQQQSQQVLSNNQPNPFMSPASGASGVAMFQQQQQKPANPFLQGGSYTSAAQGPANMQQPGGGYMQPTQQQFVSSANASFGGVSSSWGGVNQQQQQQQAAGGVQGGQPMAFPNFPAGNQPQMGAMGNQMMQPQQQQQFPAAAMATMGNMQASSQFSAVPQGYQQQQQPANMPQGFNQQHLQFAMQQTPGYQLNQFQAGAMTTQQPGGMFNAGQFSQPQPMQQKMTPQQFSGWGTNQNTMQQQQQSSHQRSSTNPFM